MAFVAGVILMYLPEEPAFRVLCQLLDEGQVGLRSLYLPGLQGLKEDLRMLDWLMERLMPQLKQHLEVSATCTPPAVSASNALGMQGLPKAGCTLKAAATSVPCHAMSCQDKHFDAWAQAGP